MISTYRRRDILTGVASGAVMLAGCSGTGPDADGGQSNGEAGTDAPPDDDTATPGNTPDDPATDTDGSGGGQYTGSFDGTYFDVEPTDDEHWDFTAEATGWPDEYSLDPTGMKNVRAAQDIRKGTWDGTARMKAGGEMFESVMTPGYHQEDWVVPVLYDDSAFGDQRPEMRISIVPIEYRDAATEEQVDHLEVPYHGKIKQDDIHPAGDTPFTVAVIDLDDYDWNQDAALGQIRLSPNERPSIPIAPEH